MNDGLRNSILAFFISVYCLVVFSPPTQIDTISSMDNNQKSEVYLTEISKLVFPQNVNQDRTSAPFVYIPHNDIKQIESPLVVTQRISFAYTELSLIYYEQSKAIELDFPPEDIIYPFHDFL